MHYFEIILVANNIKSDVGTLIIRSLAVGRIYT
nr:MAG TPA: hypothetical protein [Caudoviricetes sp.]